MPHSARVWNYLLGGKDNFAADRQTGDLIRKLFPAIAHNARVQRRLLARCPLPVYLRVAGSVGREVQAAIRRRQRPRGPGHRQQPLDLRAVGRGQHPHV